MHVWQVGSAFLGRRVEELQPSLHVFGHTHFSIDKKLDGVRYVQHPLGNQHERTNGWQIHIGPGYGNPLLKRVWKGPPLQETAAPTAPPAKPHWLTEWVNAKEPEHWPHMAIG